MSGRRATREVTAELLRRHDRPGPRYTSYPTAVEFHEAFGEEEYRRRLEGANTLGEAPLVFGGPERSLVSGVARLEEGMVLLLDPARMLSPDERTYLREVAKGGA